MNRHKRALLVSFSGIDGAGKSTQIDLLQEFLRNAGLSFKVFTFWDDVVMLSGLREWCSHKAFGGDKGVGSPDQPIERKDKNVQSWPVMMLRLFYYVLDSAHACWVASRARSTADVVIFDRYIYDELANLPLQRWFFRTYARVLLSLMARPDIAYLIDADPIAARQRKPEYPLEFLQRNRAAYLSVADLASEMKVIAPSSVGGAQQEIREKLYAKLRTRRQESSSTEKALIES